MGSMGYLLLAVGAFLVVISGVFFYNYVQQILAASTSGASGSTTVTEALGVYNGTSSMPVFVGLSIFGATFLVMGAVFLVGGHITEHLISRTMNVSPRPSESFAPMPSPARACTKCGSLLYQNTAYCPNCGGSLAQVQSNPLPAT